MESLLTSDETGQLWNVCLWNPNTGTSLLTFKGGISTSHSLNTIGKDYVITAEKTKPFVYIWNISRIDENKQSILCPGKVGSVAVSPNGMYVVFTIAEKAHLWMFAVNRKCAVVSNHYRPITVTKFTEDGSCFVTAGEDGMVIVWSVAALCASSEEQEFTKQLLAPRFVWDQHTMPVQDICIGSGGSRALVATASTDQTCKIYSLVHGQLLVSVIFNTCLTSVALSSHDASIYVGGVNGLIYEFCLRNVPRSVEYHYTAEEERSNVFTGHSKAITCVSISMDACTLASGSEDCTVNIWDIKSHQCIRMLSHKGVVTNVIYKLLPLDILNSKATPSIALPNKIKFTEMEEKIDRVTEILIRNQKCLLVKDFQPNTVVAIAEGNSSAEVVNLKKTNKLLYEFCLQKILDAPAKKKKSM